MIPSVYLSAIATRSSLRGRPISRTWWGHVHRGIGHPADTVAGMSSSVASRCKFYGLLYGNHGRTMVGTMSRTDLATAFARLRQRSGQSVRDLEETSGVSRSVISRIESGAYLNPRPATLHRLASGLGVDASELLTAAGYTTTKAEALPSMKVYLRSKYRHLSAQDRERVIELLAELEVERAPKRTTTGDATTKRTAGAKTTRRSGRRK